MTVVIATLSADFTLWDCVQSLENQTFRDFRIVIVDNSGQGLVRRGQPSGVQILESGHNLGFGAAINWAAREYPAEFIAAINDDAVADPGWLGALVHALDAHPEAGLAASQVRLLPGPGLDSAGMRIALDGSSKQRRAALPSGDCLLPSGSAALYRLDLFTRLGGFEESFFLYCEDTDLGLRALWAGWRCLYVAEATAGHHYSHSAGRASALKAYLVERNRLRLLVRCFPLNRLLLAPLATFVRYLYHLGALLEGRGAAAEFAQGGQSPLLLLWYVVKAHLALLPALPALLAARRRIRGAARLSARAFTAQLDRHRISLAEVAAL